MTRRNLMLLALGCVSASVTLAMMDTAIPPALRIALGVLIVFVLPGYAAACAVLPTERLSAGERLLACLGLSVAIATCTAVLLAATAIGLSRESFAIGLGASSVTLSVLAWVRSYLDDRRADGQRASIKARS